MRDGRMLLPNGGTLLSRDLPRSMMGRAIDSRLTHGTLRYLQRPPGAAPRRDHLSIHRDGAAADGVPGQRPREVGPHPLPFVVKTARYHCGEGPHARVAVAGWPQGPNRPVSG